MNYLWKNFNKRDSIVFLTKTKKEIYMAKVVYLADVPVGDEYPIVFMAEIGTFFNNDIEKGLAYLKRAHDAGVDVFKTEILHTADVCLPNTGLTTTFNHSKGSTTEDYRKLIERKIVSLEDYKKLFDYAHEVKIPIVASVYDWDGVDFIKENDGAGIKISRDNINNVGLIKYAASTGLPLIFDAGVAFLDEIVFAIRTAKTNGAGGVILNHHAGVNPAPPKAHNLKVLAHYKEIFNIPIGLASFSLEDEILYAAVGAGCNIIEQGVDDDPDRNEQDLVSARPFEVLPEMIKKLKNCSLSLGTKFLIFQEPRQLSTRKCLIAKNDLKIGQEIKEENLSFAWPPIGVDASKWDFLIGKVLTSEVKAGQPIHYDNIDFEN